MTQDNNLINDLLLAESILGVDRNISFYGRKKKIVVYLRIFLEISLLIAQIVIHTKKIEEPKPDLLYFYTSLGSSVFAMTITCCHSKETKDLLSKLNYNHTHCMKEIRYNKRNNKTRKLLLLTLALTLVSKTGIFILYRLVRHNIEQEQLQISFVLIILFDVHFLICLFRFNIEYFIFYSILYVMSEQLHCISRSVEEVTKLIYESKIDDNTNNYEVLVNNLDKWRDIYTNIKEASKLYNSIFGVQLTVTIGTVMFYYIVLIYALTTENLAGDMSAMTLFCFLLFFPLLLIIMYAISRQATNVHNNADMLRRRLIRLLINSQTDGNYYQPTKDLLRLVCTRPIRTQAFGSISVDMTLLPTCVLFISSYTVISLQINNVV